ncbi:hypothetical protein B7494_g2990 [Chlorociboria aeruginascens]|nr:hypothetical protein B7494_g2990 [Chlorociboria aeruginascens]
MSHHSISDSISEDLHEAKVTFKAGAEVEDVKLASDVSTIQITNLPPNCKLENVSGLLERLGSSVPESYIQIKHLGDSVSAATVRFDDPQSGKNILRKFESQPGKGANDKISMKLLPISGTLANRLQMSSVACSWYRPSSTAWLQFHDATTAIAAKKTLESHREILGRTVQCTFQLPHIPNFRHSATTSSTLQMGNLAPGTSDRHFKRLLNGLQNPRKITISKPSYALRGSEAGKIVESLFQVHGDVESFQNHTTPGGNKMKAIATFTDREGAMRAVSALNMSKVDRLGNSKLFVNHVISVKYNVQTTIINAIQRDLDQLKQRIWQNGHVHLKSYPPTDPFRSVTTLRTFGEELKSVAEAKAGIEKLLAGAIIMNGESPLWDPYFLTPASLLYLKSVYIGHSLYIHRDARKLQLLMYGGDSTKQEATQQTLIEKVYSLRLLTHTIVLTPALLKNAMRGGMRKIRKRFGETASLNASHQPKSITIQGSIQDCEVARNLLLEVIGANDLPGEEIRDCPVCWTEPTDPLTMTCGHTYCQDCFTSQAASGEDIPFRCYGAEGKCTHIFSMKELRSMLSFTAFEKLLEGSFETYIRTHPKDFQYCPTPDCPQIYRVTTTGETFTCSSCLTPICTTCNVISHDGMSCEEFKDLTSEGTKAFQKWKKENDVRDCPTCKTPIQKDFGCNHMECRQCKWHICWFCMEVFNQSKDCYNHMTSAHGNYYPD